MSLEAAVEIPEWERTPADCERVIEGLRRALEHAEKLIEDRDNRLIELNGALLELRRVHAKSSTKEEER